MGPMGHAVPRRMAELGIDSHPCPTLVPSGPCTPRRRVDQSSGGSGEAVGEVGCGERWVWVAKTSVWAGGWCRWAACESRAVGAWCESGSVCKEGGYPSGHSCHSASLATCAEAARVGWDRAEKDVAALVDASCAVNSWRTLSTNARGSVMSAHAWPLQVERRELNMPATCSAVLVVPGTEAKPDKMMELDKDGGTGKLPALACEKTRSALAAHV
jgi:hypothetical protein